MQSPFAIFRKHARVLTVVLTGLAMFAFIVLDQIQSNPQLFPIILAALLLGAAFWILGRPTGHATEYGLGGMLLGVILMAVVVPRFSRPAAAVQLSIGSLSDKDVNEHVRQLQSANQFIFQAQSAVGLQPQGNVFGFGGDPKDSAAMAYILNHEADRLGIELSDKAINDFLKQVTDGKLTQKQFREARMNLRLSETELYDILREQLRANLALKLLIPQEYSTPAQFWNYYRRLNVKQEIKVAAIPVTAFVGDSAPGDEEVRNYFEKYKSSPPSRFLSPEPTFMQPRKIRLAYLEIDYEQVRERVKQKSDITREEIETFYEENKDIRYREQPAFGDDFPPFESPRPAADDQPNKPVVAPVPGQESNEGASDAKPQAAAGDVSEKKSPEPKPDEGTEPENDGAQFSVEDDAAADGDAAAEEKPAEDKSAEDKPADENLSDEKPAESGDEKPKVETGEPAAEASPAAGAPVEAPVPVNYLPLDAELAAQIRDELLHARVLAEINEMGDAAASHLTELRREHDFDGSQEPTAEQLATRAKEIAAGVRRYAEQTDLRYVELELLGPEELSERGSKAADLWSELRGADSKPTTADRKTLDYLIVQALVGQQPLEGSRTESATVLETLYSEDSGRLYSRDLAQDPLSNNQYVFWKLEDVPAKVPELDEPGVREQVVEALKEAKAREPARERAAKLAEQVRQALEQGKTMEDALEGKTVTGEKESVELTVLDTGESFSWLSIPTAQSPNPFAPPPPSLSTITAVEKAGADFMEVVFDDLEVGEVGVAPNADHSVYYVVQVKSRTAESPGGQLAFRDAFMKQNFYAQEFDFFGMSRSFPTTYTYLTDSSQGAINSQWRQQLLEKYEYRRTQ